MKQTILEALSSRLVGKVVTAVEEPTLGEAVCLFKLGDGSSFTLHANDLAAWITDGPRSDGTYSSIGGLAAAVEACRESHGGERHRGLPEPRVRKDGDLLSVEVVDGEVFTVDVSKVSDEWEKKVLSHPDVLSFIGRVVETSDFWRSWFDDKDGYDPWIDGDREIVPDELKIR